MTYYAIKKFCKDLRSMPISIHGRDIRKYWLICRDFVPLTLYLVEYAYDMQWWTPHLCTGTDTCLCSKCQLVRLSKRLKHN